MKNIMGLEGGSNATWFKVLAIQDTTVKVYPSIKDGKVLSVLEVGFSDDFWKYKKEVAVKGHYAIVQGNAVCAAEGILDVLGWDDYKAVAVAPTFVEIYSCADYNAELERVCANV
ncbi:MAG: hypothetical protein PHO41_09770 [Eubacteriales bacterium]|nr:hypothetical protein [Eubacteriales bacterium]